MAATMHRAGVASAYDRWAPAYDLLFGRVFRAGRNDAIAAAERIGGRVLEVGVGTGISLPHYAPSTRLTGVDISEAMLAKARRRAVALGLANVEGLCVMDAETLDFPDDSFDVVVAQYVVSAVPDPARALVEFARVVRPGGEIVITTRLSTESGSRRAIERALMPVTSRLGWRADFPWRHYQEWLAADRRLQLKERRALPPLGHFSLLRVAKHAHFARAEPHFGSRP